MYYIQCTIMYKMYIYVLNIVQVKAQLQNCKLTCTVRLCHAVIEID